MAKLSRTKELWHIPKRGNVHQTIYLVQLLTEDRFIGKTWSPQKQEIVASEMGKAGLTKKGFALTHQSVRTLLANIPIYLGFVYMDESSTPPRIYVTDIGYKLVEKHRINTQIHHKNIKEYQLSGELIDTSDIFNLQMSKLIITNPSILNDCKNILVFPFRLTIKLLIELDYLDKEELGYFLFHAKNEDEFKLLIEKIRNFRSLDPEKRQAEIDAYKSTEEGKLTLVSAPTSIYYTYLCYSTGLCERFTKEVNKVHQKKIPALRLIDKQLAMDQIKKYEEVDIYDFKDNLPLWNEYFSKPNRLHPPIDIRIISKSTTDILVLVIKDGIIIASDVVSNQTMPLNVPVFIDEKYLIESYELQSGEKRISEEVIFSKNNLVFEIVLPGVQTKIEITEGQLVNKITQMFGGGNEGFDRVYYQTLLALRNIIGRNFIDNRRKGGRLEGLFFELLEKVKERNVIDDVCWYGYKAQYGICEPAPGGKEGNPDIVFDIGEYSIVLELTTVRGNSRQWSGSEASSVPDHIRRYQSLHVDRKVIGVFSAPSLHNQVEQNLSLNAQKENIPMLFISCLDLANLLVTFTREELLNLFLEKGKEQFS